MITGIFLIVFVSFIALYIREFPSLALLYRKIFFSDFTWSHQHIWRHLCYSNTVNSYTSLQERAMWIDDETLIFPTCKGTLAKITLTNKKERIVSPELIPSSVQKPYDEDIIIESGYEDMQYVVNDSFMEVTSFDIYRPYDITLTASTDGSIRLFKIRDFYKQKDLPTVETHNNFYKIWDSLKRDEDSCDE